MRQTLSDWWEDYTYGTYLQRYDFSQTRIGGFLSVGNIILFLGSTALTTIGTVKLATEPELLEDIDNQAAKAFTITGGIALVAGGCYYLRYTHDTQTPSNIMTLRLLDDISEQASQKSLTLEKAVGYYKQANVFLDKPDIIDKKWKNMVCYYAKKAKHAIEENLESFLSPELIEAKKKYLEEVESELNFNLGSRPTPLDSKSIEASKNKGFDSASNDIILHFCSLGRHKTLSDFVDPGNREQALSFLCRYEGFIEQRLKPLLSVSEQQEDLTAPEKLLPRIEKNLRDLLQEYQRIKKEAVEQPLPCSGWVDYIFNRRRTVTQDIGSMDESTSLLGHSRLTQENKKYQYSV